MTDIYTKSQFDNYAELHAHTYYSFLDGVSSPHDMIAEASRLGISSIAITDHNGLYGIVEFSTAARDFGIQAIYGAEISLANSSKRTGLFDPSGNHLVVLAKSPEGYKRLSKAISNANLLGGEKDRPIFTLESLSDSANGSWVILTGCRKGLVPATLVESGPSPARRELEKLIYLFGTDNVFVELWHHFNPTDTYRNDAMVELAYKCAVDVVATSNAHYATRDQYQLAQVLSAIRANCTLEELDGWASPSPTAHLRSPQEQAHIFSRWPRALPRTAELGIECSFDLKLIAPQLPRCNVPYPHTQESYLRELTYAGAQYRYGSKSNERVTGAWKQIDYELEIINELGYAGYFLIVWEIVEFCKSQDIYCQGRGSAANSAVCFALGITRADAVALGLLFERFLSVARDGPPDIDLDIESDRREEVIQHVYSLYGREHAGLVANIVSYKPKSAIRDVAKVFGYSSPDIERWSRAIEHNEPALSDRAYVQANTSDNTSEHTPPEIVISFAKQLIGIPRHLSIHPGGMVICDRSITEVCPIEHARMKDRTILQWDKESVAAISLVKFDLLGLGMLEALHRCVDIISEKYGIDIDLAEIPQEDQVYDLLCNADTIGIFQVESGAQMNTLPRMKPRCFYDLVVEVALIRPGPIQGQAVHPYLRRRDGIEEVTYLHPLLKKSLEKTLGIPLFQEQLMSIAIDAAGFSPAQADELRQAMGSKRSSERMERLKTNLFSGLASNGIIGKDAQSIWDGLAAFSSFGFPESHSVSFAYLVYASAWLKLHYPGAFYCALINSQPMGFWSPQSLVADAKRHQVEVLPPLINKSSLMATLESNLLEAPKLRLGLASIRSIGIELGDALYRNAPYSSIEDIVSRVRLNKDQLEALAESGALVEIEPSRRKAIWSAEPISHYRQDQLPGISTIHTSPQLPAMTTMEKIEADIHNLGLTTGPSAIEMLRPYLKSIGALTSTDLVHIESNQKVLVAGVVTHRQRPESAKGATFITLEDETGIIRATCSVGTWKRYRSVARSHPGLLISGRIERSTPLAIESSPGSPSVPATESSPGSLSTPVAINIRVEKISPIRLGHLPSARNFR